MATCVKRIYVSLLVVITLGTTNACPTLCVCRWKNGKQTVECGERNMLKIPEGIDPTTQVLEFSNNRLKSLDKDLFSKLNLINIQKLYLSHNHISKLDEQTFKGLTNLIELDLSGNLLDVIPTTSFVDCPSLMRLILSFNPIFNIKRYAFNHLTSLNTVELSSCQIENIEEHAFEGLPKLEWLKLDHNKINTISSGRILPKTLRGVELQGNPWVCDCNLLEFHSWILEFNIPSTVEPTCQKPSKFSDKPVRIIPKEELACTPEVSPASFYLEVEEGKNISLLCQIKAIPEAQVSWWFQGQLLQNDSMVSPTTRLIYFIEEGTELKKSELFIFNTDVADNGTFICNAENPAGRSHMNFTVKIILKEEPVVEVVGICFEYLLAGAVASGILLLLVLIAIIICVVKCRKRKAKQEKKKDEAQNNIKSVLSETKEETKEQNNTQEVLFYAAHSSDDLLLNMSPISINQAHLEQNPDLINDAERRQGDGEDPQVSEDQEIIHQAIFPVSCVRRKLHNLHSWDPGCSLIDMEGYPVDYGLPKPSANNCYRTLPYNRAKRQTAANPVMRFSREAEFLCRTIQPSYEHYCPDVRYTADGYPVRTIEVLASPPEEYKGGDAPSSLPCCAGVQWPKYMPANVHTIETEVSCGGKRCVGAQTDSDSATSSASVRNEAGNVGIVTESPDEGYGDEPSVVV